jgi:HPt (histidine-containing phosphotransfer) domain-containing protein
MGLLCLSYCLSYVASIVEDMQLEDRLRERENVGDADRFIESMRNVNTVRKTNSDIQKLQ